MSFVEVFKGEAKLVFSDMAIVLTIIAGVILYSFLYPQPYAKESVSKLSVSAVDLDRSELSRSILYKLNATPQIEILRRDMSIKDAQKALIEAKIKAIVVIPAHFQRDITLGMSPTIAVGADSSYFLVYGAVLEGAMQAVLTNAATIKVGELLKSEVPLSKAKEAFTPYSLNAINLFNKDNSYIEYVVPAVFIIILQQTLLIGLGILGGGINERRRAGIEGYYDKAKPYQLILSRVIIFGGIFFAHMLFYFGFSYETFGILHVANMAELLMFGFIFLLAVIMLGIVLGSLFSSREIATPLILFSSLPLVFSAGFIWPVESIPAFIKYTAYLSPSTPAIQGFLHLNQMGASFSMVQGEYVILILQILIYGFFAWFLNRRMSGDGGA